MKDTDVLGTNVAEAIDAAVKKYVVPALPDIVRAELLKLPVEAFAAPKRLGCPIEGCRAVFDAKSYGRIIGPHLAHGHGIGEKT